MIKPREKNGGVPIKDSISKTMIKRQGLKVIHILYSTAIAWKT